MSAEGTRNENKPSAEGAREPWSDRAPAEYRLVPLEARQNSPVDFCHGDVARLDQSESYISYLSVNQATQICITRAMNICEYLLQIIEILRYLFRLTYFIVQEWDRHKKRLFLEQEYFTTKKSGATSASPVQMSLIRLPPLNEQAMALFGRSLPCVSAFLCPSLHLEED